MGDGPSYRESIGEIPDSLESSPFLGAQGARRGHNYQYFQYTYEASPVFLDLFYPFGVQGLRHKLGKSARNPYALQA